MIRRQVPATYISDLRIHCSADPPCVQLLARVRPEPRGLQLRVSMREKDIQVLEAKGEAEEMVKLEVPGAKLWSPESPHLYDLHLELLDSYGATVDRVESYVGIRSVAKRKCGEHWRMTLNGQVCFHLGPLDQGYDRKVQKLRATFLSEVHSKVWQMSAQLDRKTAGGEGYQQSK
eukprot:Skav225005  [mRNA]  locus=scaffold957:15740:23041:+ [translate_table: standard]